MEILLGIAIIVAITLGLIYWYVESKIKQVKDVATSAAEVTSTVGKFATKIYKDHKEGSNE